MKKNSLKLVDKWKDSYYSVNNYHYQTPGGINIIHSKTKVDPTFSFSIILRGGFLAEKKLNVTAGTAHFLEHILAGNPNKIINTKEKFTEYVRGNKYKPEIYHNGATNWVRINLYAYGHKRASKRIVKYVTSKINFDNELLEKYIEKERRIILNELQRSNKTERDETRTFEEFVLEDAIAGVGESVIGTEDSINSITISDLEKFFTESLKVENFFISVQSDENLSPDIKSEILKLDKIITNHEKSKVFFKRKQLKPEFKFFHYKNFDKRSINLEFNLPYNLSQNDYNYLHDKLYPICGDLLQNLGLEILREEKELIYGFNNINLSYLSRIKIRGFKFSVEKEKFLEVLNECFDVIYIEAEKYLHSDKGVKFFNSFFSRDIYRFETNYSRNYSEHLVFNMMLKNPYRYDYLKSKEAAKGISIEDVAKFYKTKFISTPPIFWFSSPYEDSEIYKIFKKSKFYKKWKQ